MASAISDLASNALTSLGSSALKEAAAAWHFKSDLLKLTNTITTIRDVLVALESHHQRHDCKNLIERLKDAVHEADDLLDEFTTLVERRKIMMAHGRFMKQVRIFISPENQVTTAFTISREIKRIRKNLDDIVRDNCQFASMLPTGGAVEQFGLVRGEETCSFVLDEDVIGRDDDKRKIVDILLRHDYHDSKGIDLVILPIIGIGGLGKTTIAQLVFNDQDVAGHFEVKKWVCIGDDLGLKFIIKRIIMSFSSCSDDLSLEYMHSQLREKIGGKKYLIVLDDLWEEDFRVLFRLKELLAIGAKGSALLITARSMYTAERIGTISPMELQVLSDDASWILFDRMTSIPGQEHQKDERLVQMGKAIVKKCANLPLAIKVIGSMLRGRNEKEWQYFRDHDLAKIDNDGGIIPLLKLSYYRLSSQLKHCFAYCGLFPKDYEIEKIKLCQLWVAQGFITYSPPLTGSLEDAAERCFMGLLNRCFFQDIQTNKWGEIESFKMHDHMHDLAKEVAGEEFLLVDGSGNCDSLVRGTRHLSVNDSSSMPKLSSSLQAGNHLRTFMRPQFYVRDAWKVSDLICSFRCIKVLDLRNQRLDKLPDSIGQLIHIRYLDLSSNSFEILPKSITRLHNLQTLNFWACERLKELPWDLNKLVNLQNLDLMFCTSLEYMPSGMDSLTCLQRLTRFVVGENKSATTNHANGFGDLILLNSLRGSLRIDIMRNGTSDSMPIRTIPGCLLNKDSLSSLEIWFIRGETAEDEELLESLQPHINLKCFSLQLYEGRKFPGWMSMNNLAIVLPNLVELKLCYCESCQNLPSLSLLPSLKSVFLFELHGLEYIENRRYEASTSSKSEAFFPSLRCLDLRLLSNVKGWWAPTVFGPDLDSDQHVPLPCFPRLESLMIVDCPNMTSMPLCPGVEDLHLMKFNENLHIITETEEDSISTAASLRPSSSTIMTPSSAAPNSCCSTPPPLKFLIIDTTYYNHLPKQCLQSLAHLTISQCTEAALSKSFLQHFTNIYSLKISDCPTLTLSAAHDDEDDQLPWKCLGRLRVLQFNKLPKLATLPKGLQYLTNLEQLTIVDCGNLAELPEWIGRLSSSLKSLRISTCRRLKSLPDGIKDLTSLRRISLDFCDSSLSRRCRKLSGEDWPKIQHIPEIEVDRFFESLKKSCRTRQNYRNG